MTISLTELLLPPASYPNELAIAIFPSYSVPYQNIPMWIVRAFTFEDCKFTVVLFIKVDHPKFLPGGMT